MIECIPNFSEGRRPEVIHAIADAVRAVSGAYVLDIHIDPDHNRSVITFAGEFDALAEAAFRAAEAATLLIDMNQHKGQHPRIGATDVMPFVPLRGATMNQCIELARLVGKRIGAMLDIPVYLYSAAATTPERRELPNLRKGEYEGLRDSIQHDPARAPDYGPARMGTAGATVIGAREPLIAYNIFLNTDDVSIAKHVARAVRGSSGGLRGVRALGMLVGGRAQVSMNLVDYRHTPIHRAVDMVAREAAAYGAQVTAGELVGLMPEDALIEAGKVVLRLPHLADAQILERRLAQAIEVDNERKNAKTLRARLAARRAELRSDHSGAASNGNGKLPFPLESQMDTLWSHSVQALAAAVQELTSAGIQERVRAMLRVLGRELIELTEEERSPNVTVRAQALLLIARRAVKATESLASLAASDETSRSIIVVHLAHSVATTARLRALDILPQLEEQQRQLLDQEFAIYTQRARDLLARIDPLA